nr:reverse transcriptase domain-containing protein [Tanacetum cinerariifolium]
TSMEDGEELLDPWILFTDESSCIDGFKAGLIITNPEGMEFTYALRFRFNATNNEAEYEALIAGLRIAGQIGDLREYCDKNYHQILPIIAEKLHQKKLKAVKARLNFEEASRYSESKTPSRRRNLKEKLEPRYARTRRGRSKLPREKDPERRTVFKRLEQCVFHRLGDKEKNVSAHSRGSERKSYYSSRMDTKSCYQSSRSKETEIASEKHRHKKEYREEGKQCQVWFDDLPKESIDSYDDLRKAFLENYLQQKKCIKDPRQIEQMLKAKKLSHWIKELKQNHEKDQAKTTKKGETSGKDKPLAILMVQPWKRIARQRITQTFSPELIISFPTLGEEDGMEGPMIIEAEMKRHCVHHMYVDGGFSSKILYEHCFGKFHPEIKNQLIPANTPLVGFSGEIIWLLGQISLLVKIGDEEHSTSTWMNFLVQDHPARMLNGFRTRSTAAYMTGVPRQIAEHRLNVREGCLPVRQKKRGQAPERNKAISEEVKKLVEADIMKEVHYHREGTLLRYKVDADGLRVFPDKVEAVLDLPSPKCHVQKLNGKLASLNRFLSKSAEISLPFFKTLKKCTKKSDFQWTAKAEMAFKGMKQLIVELPMLTAPKEKEELIMYLEAAKEAISAFLMTKRDGKQVPIYFVSRALQGPEINYTSMEKLILALVSASKRLKRYFQAHTIVVIMDQPIKQLLSNPEVTGRLLKWRFELGEHDIQYRPRTSVKGQILADFIVERLEDDTPDTSMEDMEELPDPWILFTDGSSCIDCYGAGLIITNPKRTEFT